MPHVMYKISCQDFVLCKRKFFTFQRKIQIPHLWERLFWYVAKFSLFLKEDYYV